MAGTSVASSGAQETNSPAGKEWNHQQWRYAYYELAFLGPEAGNTVER